jgi:hypothetical protein
MSNKNKRKKYEKTEQQKRKPPLHLFGLIAVIAVLFIFFIFSAAGRGFINSLLSEKKELSETPAVSGESVRKNLEDNTGEVSKKNTGDDPAYDAYDADNADGQPAVVKKQPAVPDKPEFVTIPIADITRQGTYYSYTSSKNVHINYFALLDKKGSPHIAFDACDVCYRAKKGYALQGDMAICRNCGNRYPVDAIGTENRYGGCWPSYLPMTVVDKEIRIKKADLEARDFMFM